MTIRSSTIEGRRPAVGTHGKVAFATALGLLLMAILAPFAQFGVLKTLVVPSDPAATTTNIAASPGLFQAAIVAFLIVAILDLVVAWGFSVLLRPANASLARLVGSLRIVYAAAFALALLNLADAGRLADGATAAGLHSGLLRAEVAASVASFDSAWHVALGIFGLHLVGLGALLSGFAAPRLLAALVVIAGLGYVADALGTILIAGYALSIGTVTFVGEALLIVWLFKVAIAGSRSSSRTRSVVGTPAHTAEAAS